MNLLILTGSERNGSFNATLADVVRGRAASSFDATIWPTLRNLPYYDQDTDSDTPPAEVAEFRAAVAAADTVIVVSPQYNGSIPGALKNAIDWASRPRANAPIAGKPVGVLSATPSPTAGQLVRDDLLRVLTVAGAAPLAHTIGVAHAHEALAGGTADEALTAQIDQLLSDLANAAAPAETAAETAA